VSFCQVTAISTGPASPWHPHSVTEVADRLGEKKRPASTRGRNGVVILHREIHPRA
jgi:hypothetical protein